MIESSNKRQHPSFMKSWTWIIVISAEIISCSNKEDQIKNTVYKWNEIHNTHNAIEFKNLYASDVLFYGRHTPMETCYSRKNTFLTSEFHQDIISPISISYYSSGAIKCDFTKRTKYRREKVREYYCYLLIKKLDGKYFITGESDLQSDQKRNTQLDLGSKTSRPSQGKGLYIISIIVVLVAASIILIRKRKKKQATEWEIFKEQYKAPAEPEKIITDLTAVNKPIDEDLVSKVKAAVLAEMKNKSVEDSSEKKGLLFEKFVVERFDQTYFNLIEWRSDKYHHGMGIYPISSKLPDLEYHFTTSWYDCKIAVECKWRAKFNNNKIEVAREQQLISYWRYSEDSKIKVFIILGVGGSPDNPEDLYIIPLDEIPNPVLHKNQLSKFDRHRKKSNFFFHADTMTLA